MIEATSLKKARIVMDLQDKKSWLKVFWESSSEELMDKANIMNVDVRFDNSIEWNIDEIIITKR